MTARHLCFPNTVEELVPAKRFDWLKSYERNSTGTSDFMYRSVSQVFQSLIYITPVWLVQQASHKMNISGSVRRVCIGVRSAGDATGSCNQKVSTAPTFSLSRVTLSES